MKAVTMALDHEITMELKVKKKPAASIRLEATSIQLARPSKPGGAVGFVHPRASATAAAAAAAATATDGDAPADEAASATTGTFSEHLSKVQSDCAQSACIAMEASDDIKSALKGQRALERRLRNTAKAASDDHAAAYKSANQAEKMAEQCTQILQQMKALAEPKLAPPSQKRRKTN